MNLISCEAEITDVGGWREKRAAETGEMGKRMWMGRDWF